MRAMAMVCAMVFTVATYTAFGDVDISFGGYLDSDVWTDLAGNFFTNDDLDLGMTVSFTDAVKAHVYATVAGGAIPAGGGEPGSRWISVTFDGVDITFDTKIGSFAVGDLVYQYGGFNYYLYKRLSMITDESFTRGLKYSIGSDRITQTILIGAADEADVLFEHRVVSEANDTLQLQDPEAIARDANVADIVGSTALSFGEALSLSLFYGVRSDVKYGYENTGRLFAGAELTLAAGDAFEIKADVGVQNFVLDNSADSERATTIPLLIEPSLSLGSFSAALSAYFALDPDKSGVYPGAQEQMFVYLEPGFSITDNLAAGLPLEIHSMGAVEDLADAGEFWAVPTLYVYPADGVEWWTWFGAFVPLGDSDPYYGLGSEIIVEF